MAIRQADEVIAVKAPTTQLTALQQVDELTFVEHVADEVTATRPATDVVVATKQQDDLVTARQEENIEATQ